MSIDWRQGLPVLRLDGVSLREPGIADAAGLFARLTTPSVAKFLSTPPDTADGFERFIGWVQRERQHGRHVCYAIVPNGSTDPVGLIQTREVEPGFGTAEWGFALEEASWGTGLFAICATAIADFVFRHVGVHRLEARASVGNGRGNGVLKKLGAVPEGVLRRSFDNGSRTTDQVLWSLLAGDWLAAHAVPSYGLDEPVPRAPEAVSGWTHGSRTDIWKHGLPELRAHGITLREPVPADAPALTSSFNDAEVCRYITPPPADINGFEHFVEWTRSQREAGKHFCYAVVPDDERQAVGLFQVHHLGPAFKTAEWGFVFGRRLWGTGLAARSAGLLLDYMFESLGVKRLEARVVVDNARASRLLRKLGAVEEGRLRRSFLLGGQYYDDMLCSILDTDWATRRDRLHVPDPVASS